MSTSSSLSSRSYNTNNDEDDDGMMMNSGPVLIKRSAVPHDIICSICMSVPQDPVVITLCDHVFCQYCLQQSIQYTGSFCPMDRNPFIWDTDVTSLKEGSFIYRIWCNVQVKCQYYGRGCSWTGSIHDFVQSHKEACFYNDTNRRSKRLYPLTNGGYGSVKESEEYIELKQKYDQLERETNQIKNDCYEFKVHLEQWRSSIREIQENTEQLQRDLSRHIQMNDATLRPDFGSFDGTYQYYRDDVTKLNNLLATWLVNKPSSIDPNRIYNCIQRCYVAHTRNYTDNPPHYSRNIRMLLTTAAASTWFSERQKAKITQWLQHQGWYGQ